MGTLIYTSAKAVSDDQFTFAKLMRWVLSQSETLALLCFQRRAFYRVHLTLGIALCSLRSNSYDLHTLIIMSWLGYFSLFHQKIIEQKGSLWKRSHSIPSGIISWTPLLCMIVGPYRKEICHFFLKGTNGLILSC